jgi:competence ComEA-like helix-hairpin-helix protein
MARESGRKISLWLAIAAAAFGVTLASSVRIGAQEPAPPTGASPATQAPSPAGSAAQAAAAPLPSGPGSDAFQRVCVVCHPPDRIVSVRKTRTEWEEVIDKMITKGAQVTDDNYGPIEDFLLRNYGTVNVNKAVRDDLVAILGVTPADASAILAFRTSHGPFADFAALEQVPGIDSKKLEQKKAAVTF